MSCHEFETLLNPYLDGELHLTEALGVERHLASCLVCRSQYQSLEQLRAEIQAAHLDYIPSPQLEARIRKTRQMPRRWTGGAMVAVAAVAAMLIALFAQLPITPSDTTSREIFDGHLRSLLAPNLVDVPSSDRHTVKPWFQGKLGFSPDVPDLTQEGFVLIGGRLDIIHQQRAVALVYKRREHVINLFIAESGSSPAPEKTTDSQGYHLISWTERNLSYWAVSDLNPRELGDFVELIRR